MKTKLCATVVLFLGQLAGPNRVHAGGLVAAWGDNYFGQTTLPVGVNNVKVIAAGLWDGVALKADGTANKWGYPGTDIAPVSSLSGITDVAVGSSYSLLLTSGGNPIDLELSTNALLGFSNVTAVAAGWYHRLILKSDGTLETWKDGGENNTPDYIPPGLSNVKAIAAGLDFSLALKTDGTVVAWGWNAYGQTNVPPGLSNVVAIAASCGSYHSLALKADGTVVAWGADWSGQTDVPSGLSNVVAVAAGDGHSLALKADGTVVAWGDDSSGETNIPVGLSNVTAIAAGGYSSFALVSDGPVQITRDLQPQSQAFPPGSNVTYSVAATGTGTLSYQWFLNGQPVTNNSHISGATGPTLKILNLQMTDMGTYTVIVSNAFGSVISSGAALTVISPPFITSQSATNLVVGAGTNVAMTVSADGTPPLNYQWSFNGTNLAGATGASLSLANVQPGASGIYSLLITNFYGSTQVDFSLTVTDRPPYILTQPMGGSVLLGRSFTFTVSARGSLPLSYQWRFNGQNLFGATSSTLMLSNLNYNQTGYYDVAVGNPFGTAVSAKVLLSVGQTAVQVWSPYASSYVPTNVPPNLTNAVAIAAGYYHVLVLKRDGTVATWAGSGLYSPTVTNVPASVNNVVAIAAGSYGGADSSMALKANGTVVVWGDNYYGITNVPVTATNVVAIADGGDHCLALKSDGTMVGWGLNTYGQATSPSGLSNVVAVAAGNLYSMALRNDGTIIAWGYNANGQTNAPSGLSNVIAISANTARNTPGTSMALKADGTVTNWGYQFGVKPSNVTNIVAISAAAYAAAALKSDGTVIAWGAYQNNFLSSISNVIAMASGGYSPVFLAIIVGDGSPFITIQPVSQTTTNGATARFHTRAVGAQPLVYIPQRYVPKPLSYQWQFNGSNITGATNSDLIITNATGASAGSYQAVITNYLGAVVSKVAQLTIVSAPYNGTLAAALNATNLVWTASPTNALWFAEISITHDGVAAAQSGHISDSQQSAVQTIVTGPGVLTFWWKVSSEEGYDFLNFFMDSTNQPTASVRISGEVDWQQLSFNIPSGAHNLFWIYSKDYSVSAGQDAGWLDQIAFTPAPLITQQPQSQTAWAGSTAIFQAGATWGGIANVQWLKNGTNLPTAHSMLFTLTNLTRRDSGMYALQISNAGGSVTSSIASLVVLVPQRLSAPRLLPDGSFAFTSEDADGGRLQPDDLAGFEVQVSTDLVDWVALPGALTLTNSVLQLHDPAVANVPMRFYRIIENR